MTDPTSKLSLPDVPDILCQVFSYLDPIHYSGERMYEVRQSLATAARTCRGFTGPALDILWKRLPDDQPLSDLLCTLGIAAREVGKDDIQVLQVGANNLRRDQLPRPDGPEHWPPPVLEALARSWKLWRGYDIKYVLQDGVGDPRKHPGWPRFVEYASRVRVITLFAFDGPAWCALWEELLSVTDRALILPNLFSVAFCDITRDTVHAGALSLISRSVRKLNFSIDSPVPQVPLDERLCSLLVQCFYAAPEIEQLRLELPPFRLGTALLQTHCSRVNYLEVFPQIHLRDLSVLAELPSLRYLAISLASQPTWGLSEPPTSLAFDSISTLVVEGTWVNVRTVLDILRLPSIESLSVKGWHYGDPAVELARGATECFHTVSRHTSITHLSISTAYGRIPCDYVYGVTPLPEVRDAFEAPPLDIMHPLLSLSALRDVSLDFPEHFVIACTSSDLRIISKSWPELEALHLLVSRYRGDASDFIIHHRPARGSRTIDPSRLPEEYPHGGPLEAIAHFARNCPRLCLLHLSAMEMTEESLAAAKDLLDPSREPHALRTLVVPQVQLPSRRADLFEKIPEVIRAVFPRAKCAFRAPRRVGVGYERWVYADVSIRCPVCQADPKLPF